VRYCFTVTVPDWLECLLVWPVLIYRRVRYGYSFRRIRLTQGQYAIVDVGDHRRLGGYKWFAVRYPRGYYAIRGMKDASGRQKNMRMHREILEAASDRFVDHINHDGLDNRRVNLRIVTCRQNSWNKRKQRGNCSSRYKGVTWFKRSGKWQARIVRGGKSRLIGYFDDEKAAASAYDAKAEELFGEYAVLNLRDV